ncbi:MAG: A/G-specific adenine glycosylase [Fimbriimonadaceae bacterium]|nr:A/G-specific adenine glycosylase [Fimbriimonadaceae bacterium]
MTGFQTALLSWYEREGRPLPWRETRDPYRIWVSEVMLQQTRVATVQPRFERWFTRFPTVHALADALEEAVLDEWAGLGYYSRARRLHAGAKHVVAHGWPTTEQEWRAVPGVGRYTAGALASIVLGLDAPVVDGNVVRVYRRFCADPRKNPEPRAWAWATEVRPQGSAAPWNQALMELGATVCVPRFPKCAQCPVADWCQGLYSGSPEAFSAPRKGGQAIQLGLTVMAHVEAGMVGLRKVPKGSWWQGLSELPTTTEREPVEGATIGTVRHAVTRHRIVAEVRLTTKIPPGLDRYPLAGPLPGMSALSQKAISVVRRHYDVGRSEDANGAKTA